MPLTIASAPQLVIENVTPKLDGGRYPIKRVIGNVIEVSADIFKDGHDLIAARLLYRRPGEASSRVAPLTYRFDPDRWHGSFKADQIGLWQYDNRGVARPLRHLALRPRQALERRARRAPRVAGRRKHPGTHDGKADWRRQGPDRRRCQAPREPHLGARRAVQDRFRRDVAELVRAPLFADEASR